MRRGKLALLACMLVIAVSTASQHKSLDPLYSCNAPHCLEINTFKTPELQDAKKKSTPGAPCETQKHPDCSAIGYCSWCDGSCIHVGHGNSCQKKGKGITGVVVARLKDDGIKGTVTTSPDVWPPSPGMTPPLPIGKSNSGQSTSNVQKISRISGSKSSSIARTSRHSTSGTNSGQRHPKHRVGNKQNRLRVARRQRRRRSRARRRERKKRLRRQQKRIKTKLDYLRVKRYKAKRKLKEAEVKLHDNEELKLLRMERARWIGDRKILAAKTKAKKAAVLRHIEEKKFVTQDQGMSNQDLSRTLNPSNFEEEDQDQNPDGTPRETHALSPALEALQTRIRHLQTQLAVSASQGKNADGAKALFDKLVRQRTAEMKKAEKRLKENGINGVRQQPVKDLVKEITKGLLRLTGEASSIEQSLAKDHQAKQNPELEFDAAATKLRAEVTARAVLHNRPIIRPRTKVPQNKQTTPTNIKKKTGMVHFRKKLNRIDKNELKKLMHAVSKLKHMQDMQTKAQKLTGQQPHPNPTNVALLHRLQKQIKQLGRRVARDGQKEKAAEFLRQQRRAANRRALKQQAEKEAREKLPRSPRVEFHGPVGRKVHAKLNGNDNAHAEAQHREDVERTRMEFKSTLAQLSRLLDSIQREEPSLDRANGVVDGDYYNIQSHRKGAYTELKMKLAAETARLQALTAAAANAAKLTEGLRSKVKAAPHHYADWTRSSVRSLVVETGGAAKLKPKPKLPKPAAKPKPHAPKPKSKSPAKPKPKLKSKIKISAPTKALLGDPVKMPDHEPQKSLVKAVNRVRRFFQLVLGKEKKKAAIRRKNFEKFEKRKIPKPVLANEPVPVKGKKKAKKATKATKVKKEAKKKSKTKFKKAKPSKKKEKKKKQP